MKKVKLFEQFITEGKDIFPNEVVGNDQILFKKEWEKMNGGKLAAKYNQYYKGYNIDAGGRIFNSVDQLEKYIKATELSNNQYNKYKYMPEKPIGESIVNEGEKVIKGAFGVKKVQTLIDKYGRDNGLFFKRKSDGKLYGVGSIFLDSDNKDFAVIDDNGDDEYIDYKDIDYVVIKESTVNEEAAYTVTKNTYRDYDNLNITSYDSIQFKQDGKKWIVRVVTAHDNIDKNALQKLGFTNQSDTRYAGISTFTKNANWHDLELTKKQFDQLVKIVDAGWASHAKAFADFYRDREAD